MVNPNDKLLNAQIIHEINKSRFTKRAIRLILEHIQAVHKRASDSLLIEQELINKVQLEAFLLRLEQLFATGYAELNGTLQKEIADLINVENDFNQQTLKAVTSVQTQAPTFETIYAAVTSDPLIVQIGNATKSIQLQDWIKAAKDGAFERVKGEISLGYTEGLSTSKVAARIRGDLTVQSKTSAELMVRTAFNHISSTARSQIAKDNEDLIQGEMWNAILDQRTTPICRSRDGKIYPLGEGVRPPAHIGCRSFMTMVLKDHAPPQRRDYADWFKDQSAETQDNILGKTKGKLYRDGGLPLDRFTDDTGKELTLTELRRKYADYFKTMEQKQ